MFQTKTPVAVLAGMAVAGSILVAPGVVAAPTSGIVAGWGYNGSGELGNNTTTDSKVPVAASTAGVLAGRTVTAIAAGYHHTCAVADGRAYCWGWDSYGAGELGDNSSTNTSVPVAVDTSGVLAGKTITAISAGAYHSCAVADGQAYCWGKNRSGQLGNDSTTDSTVPVPVPVDTSGVLAGKTVTAISAGAYHSCAVADGQAYCWGFGGAGQLGNNSTTDSTVPFPAPVPVPVAVDTAGVLADKTITAITAGYHHTCAVADGHSYCWGRNSSGQLGNNSTIDSTVPVAVNTSGVLADKTITAIAAGGNGHTCAVADGRAYCWGRNKNGRLGNNSTIDTRVPIAVASGVLARKTVTAITAGYNHTCAVADGQAYCWGYNRNGRLGNNSTTKSRVPVAVNTSGPLHHTLVTAIAAGGSHTAAIAVPMTSVPPPPPAVTGIKAAVKKRPVKITWKPVTAATSYRVRISKPGGKKYKKWKTTSTRVFKTKARKGKKYRFQVAAVGVGGRGPTTTKRFKAK